MKIVEREERWNGENCGLEKGRRGGGGGNTEIRRKREKMGKRGSSPHFIPLVAFQLWLSSMHRFVKTWL